MNKLPLGLPSSVGQVSSSWLADEELRRIRTMALRGQRRRNSSYSSLSTVSEYDTSEYHGERRGSAPEWDHINRFLQARRSSQTLPDSELSQSGRRGSYPVTRSGWDNDDTLPYDIVRRLWERERGRMPPRRQSLQTGEVKWGESTMTMDTTTSLGATFNGRQLKFKVILLGDCGVGKSSFLQTFLKGEFTASMPNTNLAMSNATSTLQHNGLDVELQFCDTAGQERYRSITASYYRHAQGCLVFYNVHYRSSFEHIESWLDDLDKYGKRETMAVILVGLTHKHQADKQGTKENVTVDSELDTSNHNHSKREVPRAQAEHLASNCSLPYMEADIQGDPNSVSDTIQELLDLLVRRVMQNREMTETIKPKDSKSISVCCRYC